jgi:hypothetical protein
MTMISPDGCATVLVLVEQPAHLGILWSRSDGFLAVPASP